MPYSIFKRLDLGELRPLNISLPLVDRSIKYPLGILEDIPIKVGDFHVPINFVILDMFKMLALRLLLVDLFWPLRVVRLISRRAG